MGSDGVGMLQLRRCDQVQYRTINRAERRNAIDTATWTLKVRALIAANSDAD